MKRVAMFGLAVALSSTVAGSVARADEPSVQGQVRGPLLQTTTSPAEKRSLLVPAVLVGTGVVVAAVGVILVATAPETPSNCTDDTQTCVRAAGTSDADFTDQQDRAGRAHALPIAGWLTVGIGGMLAAAGVLSYAFGPEPKPRRRATLTPWLASTAGGLSALATF